MTWKRHLGGSLAVLLGGAVIAEAQTVSPPRTFVPWTR